MTEVFVTEDKTAVVVVASYRSVSRNPVRFKALGGSLTCSDHVKHIAIQPKEHD